MTTDLPVGPSSTLAELRAFIDDRGLDVKTSGKGRTKKIIYEEIVAMSSTQGFSTIGKTLASEDPDAVFQKIDGDADGSISPGELRDFLEAERVAAKQAAAEQAAKKRAEADRVAAEKAKAKRAAAEKAATEQAAQAEAQRAAAEKAMAAAEKAEAGRVAAEKAEAERVAAAKAAAERAAAEKAEAERVAVEKAKEEAQADAARAAAEQAMAAAQKVGGRRSREAQQRERKYTPAELREIEQAEFRYGTGSRLSWHYRNNPHS